MTQSATDQLRALEKLREELLVGGRSTELEALDLAIAAARSSVEAGAATGAAAAPGGGMAAVATSTSGARQTLDDEPATRAPRSAGAGTESKAPRTYLKLKKKYYTPAEVAKRVGVSRQTIVKWIERGELEAELTPGGHHRIPASVFHREGRGDAVQLIPVSDE